MLNAFRHHGERDWKRHRQRTTTKEGCVLNAFRHHGERDTVIRDDTQRQPMCSTPSGITASGTSKSASLAAM